MSARAGETLAGSLSVFFHGLLYCSVCGHTTGRLDTESSGAERVGRLAHVTHLFGWLVLQPVDNPHLFEVESTTCGHEGRVLCARQLWHCRGRACMGR